jgi:hypothetical protein
MLVYCHRCAKSTNVRGLLGHMDPELKREYSMEEFADKHGERKVDTFEKSVEVAKKIHLPWLVEEPNFASIRVLPDGHYARQYVESRGIPQWKWGYLYHTENFNAWANGMLPEPKYDDNGQPRLVMKVEARNGDLVGFQGRAYGPAKSKYLTAAVTREPPFLFGFDSVNPDKFIPAFEGPIDSMFVQNAVASCGGKITRELMKTGLPKEQFSVCYDNEPRSKATVDKMELAIEEGFPVFFWPDTPYKDINDFYLAMIKSGDTPEQADARVNDMVRERTFYGMAAELELKFWKKV